MSQVAVSIEPQDSLAVELCDSTCDGGGSRFATRAVHSFTDFSVANHSAAAALRSAALHADERAADPDGTYAVCKRVSDVVISLAAIVFLSPLILVSAIIIKLHDGGPLFFSQIRVGKGGQTFRCLKFRSMILNAESLQGSLLEQSEHSDPRTFKISDDPRITLPGRILRRFSIDELPQVINVLLGEMSIVGPRPPLPSEVALYSRSDRQRLSVKPGLTCIWQVSGRSRLPFPEQLKLDLEYIRTRSLKTDAAIILRTIPAVLSGDGAS